MALKQGLRYVVLEVSSNMLSLPFACLVAKHVDVNLLASITTWLGETVLYYALAVAGRCATGYIKGGAWGFI